MDKQNKKLVINVGIAVIAYFGVVKPILQKLGVMKTKEEKAKENARQKAIDDEKKAVAKSGQSPTKSDAEWIAIVEQIYQDIRYSAIDDNKADAAYQLQRAKNNADVILMVDLFGMRREYWFGIPAGDEKDLFSMVRYNLSSTQINTVNNNWQRKNIKYRI